MRHVLIIGICILKFSYCNMVITMLMVKGFNMVITILMVKVFYIHLSKVLWLPTLLDYKVCLVQLKVDPFCRLFHNIFLVFLSPVRPLYLSFLFGPYSVNHVLDGSAMMMTMKTMISFQFVRRKWNPCWCIRSLNSFWSGKRLYPL